MPIRSARRPVSAAAMSIPDRHASPENVAAGARTFFVTSSTWGRRHLLQSERSAPLFIRVLYEYRAQRRYRLHEFVVMPDHFHLLITTGADTTIERAVQFVKGGFAFRAGRELGMRAPVWQKGFSDARISDAVALARARDYIHRNLVARALATSPEAYPYSSAHHSSAHPGFEFDPPPPRLKPGHFTGSLRHG